MFFSVKWQSAFVYLEYIVFFSKYVKQDLNHFWRILTLLQNAGVTMKQKRVRYSAKLATTWVMLCAPDDFKWRI